MKNRSKRIILICSLLVIVFVCVYIDYLLTPQYMGEMDVIEILEALPSQFMIDQNISNNKDLKTIDEYISNSITPTLINRYGFTLVFRQLPFGYSYDSKNGLYYVCGLSRNRGYGGVQAIINEDGKILAIWTGD